MLDGCHVFVMEDEYLIAQEIRLELGDAGAIVIGPDSTVSQGLKRISSGPKIDVAVLDVNLGGETVFPVADLLSAGNVPLIFATGYQDTPWLDRYPGSIKFVKPFTTLSLVLHIRNIIQQKRKAQD